VKHLLTLNKYFLKYKWHLLAGILFVTLSNYFNVLQPRMIREALDLVIETISIYRLTDGTGIENELGSFIGRILLYFGSLVLILALIMGVFMYFMRQTIIVMSRLIEYDIRKEIFQHYEDLDQSFYRNNSTGDMMSRITEDVSKVRMYIGPAILYSINLVSLFVMVIYSMFSVNVTLTLWTLLPLPFLSVSIYFVSNLINKKSYIIQKQLSLLNSIAQEVYSGIRIVKSYVRETSIGQLFMRESNVFRSKSLDLAKVNAFFYPLMLLLIGTSTIITIYIGGIQVSRGQVSPGNILEFVIYVNMLTWPVTAIGWIASIVQQAEASQKRINEFLHTQPRILSGHVTPEKLKGEIAFENVSYTYPDTGIRALKNVSFKVAPGQKLGIVGRTASGKTTIADLILRFFDPTSGRITIDGIDLKELDIKQLRTRIGYVPQDVFLFSDTVHNNITFGYPNAERDEVIEYAKYASVHRDILDLPNQYDTMTGERGVSLSGGQKQRISIARAFIKKPDVIILDDCLSAVDTTTEQTIIKYLRKTLKNKTTIMVTHRLNALVDFDKILVMDQGEIIEHGNHEELIAQKGVYFEILEQQQLQEY
jgi:ATP-binding cassette subfamily B protein